MLKTKALLLSLCSLAFLNSNAIKDSLNLRSNQTYLTTKIEYEDKDEVFLRNDNDSSKVEEVWDSTNAHTISTSLDVSNINDKSNLWVEIKVPEGMDIKIDINSLKNDFITEIDLSNYRKTNYNIESGTNAPRTYTPNNGTFRLKINETIKNFSFEFILGIDEIIFNQRSTTVHRDNEYALEISLINNGFTIDKNILDKITSKALNYSSFYWHPTNFNYTTIGLDREFKDCFLFDDKERFYKNIEIEIEKPYVIKNEEKIYLESYNISASNKGTFTEYKDKIIFNWNNFYGKSVTYSFKIIPDDNILDSGDIIYMEAKPVYGITGINSENQCLYNKNHKDTSTVVPGDEEYILSGAESTYASKPFEQEAVISRIGQFYIKNYGANSNPKYLKFDFPTEGIGVKAFKALAPNYANNYQFNVEIMNKKTNNITKVVYNYNKASTSNHQTGLLINIDNIISSLSLNLNKEDCFIKSIEYEIPYLPSWYLSQDVDPRYPTISGNVYGVVFDDAELKNYESKMTITDLVDESSIEKNLNTTIKDNCATDLRFGTFSIKDDNNKDISNIEAGNTINLSGTITTSHYAYQHSQYFGNPIFYIRVPEKFNLNTEKISFTYYKAGTGDINLNYDIININNPRILKDGTRVYDIVPDLEGNIVGHYTEALGNIGYLKFNISIDIAKNQKTKNFNIKDFLYISDKYFSMSTGYADSLDVDGDGNTSEKMYFNGTYNISVLSSSAWLNTQSTVITSNGEVLEDSLSLTLDDNNKYFRFNVSINNDNKGFVNAGDFKYYIPIPKKNIEFDPVFGESNFNFNVLLNSKIEDIEGFDIMYSYDNLNYMDYSSSLNLSKVCMVRIVNNRDILENEISEISLNLSYEENSYIENSDNIIKWNAYGTQKYNLNGNVLEYSHSLGDISLKILELPSITKNPYNSKVETGGNAKFEIKYKAGVPTANGNWQVLKNNQSQWIDLSCKSTVLYIENPDYSMNNYKYRYKISNEAGTVYSEYALLTVQDEDRPIINYKEIINGDNYKIEITVTDNDGVSHIILPDGTKIDGDYYLFDAKPNIQYLFKAYDLAGNETTRTIMIGIMETQNFSSNLDIYVKCENTLSFSIDTNSVTFENYSGVEELVKENAINLNIKSSLPYKINAYIDENISGSNGNNLNKSILYIKEHSQESYKQFEDNNSVLLIDDQMDGNNKHHGIDLKLNSNSAVKSDVYRAIIKFEIEQK